MEHMLERYPGDRSNTVKMELRRYLANFGLGGDDLPVQKISTMSGGQKCRLCLAAALKRKPHLIILDEPTSEQACPSFFPDFILSRVSLLTFVSYFYPNF